MKKNIRIFKAFILLLICYFIGCSGKIENTNFIDRDYFMAIPKDMIGIDGSKLKDEFRIKTEKNKSINVLYNDFTALNNDSGEKLKSQLIASVKDEKLKIENFDPYENLIPYTDLRDEVDLEGSHANSFTHVNINSIERFYRKLNKDDAVFIIKNLGSNEKIKNYFLKSPLSSMPLLKLDKSNSYKHSFYISENYKGLFFCLQKINFGNGAFKECFQIYDFNDISITGVDTESSVLIGINGGKNIQGSAVDVFETGGKFIKNIKLSEGGFGLIPNEQYREIFVYSNSLENFLYKIGLNQILNSNYNIYANYSNKDDSVDITGIIFQSNVKSNPPGKMNLSAKINQDGRIISEKKNIPVDGGGIFRFNFNKDSKGGSITIGFYADSKLIKTLLLNDFQDSRFFIDKDDMPGIIMLKEDKIFKNNNARFSINNDELPQIDSIYYTWSTDSIKSQEFPYKDDLKQDLKIPVPDEIGKYKIDFDILLKNGGNIRQSFILDKIEGDTGKNLISLMDHNGEHDKIDADFYCPYDSFDSTIVLVNRDIISYERLNLKKGYNLVSLNSSSVSFPFYKCLVVIKDHKSNSQITYIKSIYNNDIYPGLKIKYDESEKDINVDFISDDSFLNNKIFFQYSPVDSQNSKSLVNSLNSFNDLSNPGNSNEIIYSGSLIDGKRNMIIKKENGASCDFEFAIMKSDDKIYYYDKKYYNKKAVSAEYIGPDIVDENDRPSFKINLKNNTNIRQDFLLKIAVNRSDTVFIKNLSLEPKRESSIDFDADLKKYSYDKNLNIDFILMDAGKIINYFSKKIKYKSVYKIKELEISGSIIDNREIKTYLKVPDESFDDFIVELNISSDKNILNLSKNGLLKNIKLPDFDFELLKFLNEYYGDKSLNNTINIRFINNYYIRGSGIKRLQADNFINIRSSCLYLLASTVIPELHNEEMSGKIKQNLLDNHKKEILGNDFFVYLLSESNIMLDEINEGFLDNINGTERAVYYNKYFIKNNIDILEIKKGNAIAENSGIIKLLRYFNGTGNYKIEQFFQTQNIVESVLLKLFLLKNTGNNHIDNPINIKFKSSKLENFDIVLQNNDMVYKKYYFQFNGIIPENGRMFDFNISKSGRANLYYLARLEYKGKPFFVSKNENIEIYAEYLNNKQEIIKKDDLNFMANSSYFINLYVICNKDFNKLYLMPLSCSGMQIDYESIFCNSKKCELIGNNSIYLKLDNLKQGINIVKYQIYPKYSGIYDMTGNIVFDPADLDNYLGENTLSIEIK